MPTQAASSVRIAAVTLLLIVASPRAVRAEGGLVNIMAELEYRFADVESKNKLTGEEIQTDFSYFQHKYNVSIVKELFPLLSFRGGGLFEFIDTTTKTSNAPNTGSDQRSMWMYSELNLTNPLYSGSVAYRRREFEFNPRDIAATRISREEWAGIFRWRPEGLPTLDLDFSRWRIWDGDDTRDVRTDRFVLKNRYNYRDFSYDYTYSRIDTDRRIEGNAELLQLHNGGASYSRDFFSDRLHMTTSARLSYQTLEPTEGAIIERPTSPAGSDFYLTDDSDDTTLTTGNPADPCQALNIGRNAPLIPVAAGLDFGPPTEVDTIHVLLHEDENQSLPCTLANSQQIANVANLFVWTVFSSDDQMNWNPIPGVSVDYDVFDNRFAISFSPPVETPYIKVVTTPVTTAAGEIRIADVRAFTTFVAEPGMTLEDFDQTYNFGLRWEVTDRTTTSYDVFLRHQESKPFNDDRTTVSNSVSLQHYFSPWLKADGRVIRTDTNRTLRGDSVHHAYTASLRADLLDTLTQTLIYSGRHDKDGKLTSITNSVFLRTDADLYDGWSANLDLGYSWRDPFEARDFTNATVRIATNVDPNPRLNFNADYVLSWITEQGEPSRLDQQARIQGFWVPLRTLSFLAAVNLRDRWFDGEGLKIAQAYSANWAPFPDGLLNFSLAYNYTIDTQDNEISTFSPEVSWQMTRTTLLTVRFDLGTFESDTEKRDVRNIRATLRTSY
jgi:hypothetical protein